MTYDLLDDDLIDNPTARVPVAICLDVSGSMQGPAIRELNAAVQLFFDSVRDDEVARYAVEACIVTFGHKTECLVPFSAVDKVNAPTFQAGGSTPMGAGVGLALRLLKERKEQYTLAGIDYFQPWLVLISDGGPTDDISQSATQATLLANQKRLSVFAVGVGPSVDLAAMKRFSPRRTPLRLQGLEFGKLFEWLSQSARATSVSTPGEEIPLDTNAILTWANV